MNRDSESAGAPADQHVLCRSTAANLHDEIRKRDAEIARLRAALNTVHVTPRLSIHRVIVE